MTYFIIVERRWMEALPVQLLLPLLLSRVRDSNYSTPHRPSANSTAVHKEHALVHCNPAADNTPPLLPSDTGCTDCWYSPRPHHPRPLIDLRSYGYPIPTPCSPRASRSRRRSQWPCSVPNTGHHWEVLQGWWKWKERPLEGVAAVAASSWVLFSQETK